jgi:large repetitive protein
VDCPRPTRDRAWLRLSLLAPALLLAFYTASGTNLPGTFRNFGPTTVLASPGPQVTPAVSHLDTHLEQATGPSEAVTGTVESIGSLDGTVTNGGVTTTASGGFDATWTVTGAAFPYPVVGNEYVSGAPPTGSCPCPTSHFQAQVTGTFDAVYTTVNPTAYQSSFDPDGPPGNNTMVTCAETHIQTETGVLTNAPGWVSVSWKSGSTTDDPSSYAVAAGTVLPYPVGSFTVSTTSTYTGNSAFCSSLDGNSNGNDAARQPVGCMSFDALFDSTGNAPKCTGASSGLETAVNGDVTSEAVTADCSNSIADCWTINDTWQLPGAYKISFYAASLHGSVGFTWPNGYSETHGKRPTGNYQSPLTQTALIQSWVVGYLADDSGISWDWRITYPVTEAEFNNSLEFANNPINTNVYNFLFANCVDFLQGLAANIDLPIPDWTDTTFTGLVGFFNTIVRAADGAGMKTSFQQIASTSGGQYSFTDMNEKSRMAFVEQTDGKPIGNAPDPPAPIDPGSGGPLAQASLSDPSGTASLYQYAYSDSSLATANIAGGAALGITETPSGDTTSMTLTSIDWGDGSTPYYSIQENPATGGQVPFTHTYSVPGTYTDKVVVVEDGALVEWDGTVVVGAQGGGSQSFTVPAPGPYVSYGLANPGSVSGSNGGGGGGNSLPGVTSIAPASGPSSGGTAVTISGSGFTGATSVLFGTIAAATFAVTSDGQISAVAPAGSGTIDITVTNSTGTSAAGQADRFSYVTVSAGGSSVAAGPTSVPADGRTASTITVTLLDTNTHPVQGDAISLASNSGTSSAITAIQATTDANGHATFSVTDAMPESVTYTATDSTVTPHLPITQTATVAFTVSTPGPPTGVLAIAGNAQSIVSWTPPDSNGGSTITGYTVTPYIGGAAQTPATAGTSPTNVSITGLANGTVYTFTVHATNSGGNGSESGVSNAVTPNPGGTAWTYCATEGGTCSFSGTQIVRFGAVGLYAYGQFTGQVNCSTGVFGDPAFLHQKECDVETSVSATNSTVAANPTSVPADGKTSSIIAATLLDADGNPVPGKSVGLAANNGSSSQITVTQGTTDASGRATFTVLDATPETSIFTATVTSDTPNVTVTQTASVTFLAVPSVTGVSPASGPGPGGTTVTVNGANLTGATAVDFGDTPGMNLSVNPAGTSLSVTSPSGTGLLDVTVTTPVGTSAKTGTSCAQPGTITAPCDAFSYSTKPAASASKSTVAAAPSAVPADGMTASTITVTLLDGNGNPVQGDSVTLAATPGAHAVISPASGPSNSAGIVSFTIKDGTAEAATLTATDTSASPPLVITETATVDFLAPPIVKSISPASGPSGGGTVVTVTGSNLTGATAVNFGNANPGTSIFVNGTGTSLTVTSPAGADAVDLTVTTPGGTSAVSGTTCAQPGTSAAPCDAFAFISAPAVTSVSPASGPAGGGTAVTVAGANLTGATAVNFGGTQGTNVAVGATGTSLSVTSPAGRSVVDVTVVTPAGTSMASGSSCTQPGTPTAPCDAFTYIAAPVVTEISPTSGPAGGGTAVIVNGSGLTGATAVSFGGTSVPASSFTSASDSSITVPSPAGTASVDVTVTTPAGTSATSVADQFTFVAPLALTSPSALNGTVDVPWSSGSSAQFSVFGGVPPYNWTPTGSPPLPSGLVFDSNSGLLSGTPTTPGSYPAITVSVSDSESPAQTQSATITLAIAPAPLVITTTTLPPGAVNQNPSYSETLLATGGTLPLRWALSTGSLPPGLSLSSAGAITGTPTKTGTYNFTVQATDASAPTPLTATQPLSIVVGPKDTLALRLPPANQRKGTVGDSTFSAAPAASGGKSPYTWSIGLGTLPPGLTINPSTGVISGTPTTNGSFTFTLYLTDSNNPPQTASAQLTLVINPPLLSISTSSPLPGATAGTPYSVTFQATGGIPGYTWVETNVSPNPGSHPISLKSAGLMLDPATGTLSGTPTKPGTATFTVHVEDSGSGKAGSPIQTTKQQFTLKIAPLPLAIATTSPLASGTTGRSYSTRLTAIGGYAPYSWSLASGSLPAGLTLNSTTGRISGSPTSAGTYGFTVQLGDSGGTTPVTATFSLRIQLRLAPASLPGGTVGTKYGVTLTASGGSGGYTYSISSGSLPPGLSLTGNKISGTPTAPGSYPVTFSVTDSAGNSGNASYALVTVSKTSTTPSPARELRRSSRLHFAFPHAAMAWDMSAVDQAGRFYKA